MQIERTKIIGFCSGVRRAIKMAEQERNAYIAGGEIIHNPQETTRLKKEFNINPSKISDIPHGSTAIIRAHGIGEAEQKSMKDKNIKIIDATCPHVKRVQNLAREFTANGYNVFLFGEKGHAEVHGICGHANTELTVFSSVAELESIILPEHVALISQTTKPTEEFCKAEELLSKKVKYFKSVCTICNATQENQKAAAELAKLSDIMIVIGGKSSSNTKALVTAATPFCNDIYQVESAADLRQSWFIGKKRCGIAAGLSTPDYSIDEVEAAIGLL
ncbi:MAG: 4-hydroxy-3-methylbut-2-enyl diphosphate reductase [Alphaproteobacteria bacterium]|nr:4-hydroxy-3-methylbut-2-enyl diphosphate reductase [Alphaproteobacteria bacterium]